MIVNYNTIEIIESDFWHNNVILILSNGLEERTLGTLNYLVQNNIKILKVIIFDYQDISNEIGFIDLITDTAKLVSNDIYIQEGCLFSDPSPSLKSFFRDKIIDYSSNPIISIDITSFSIPYYFGLLSFFETLDSIDSFNILYSTPDSYADKEAGVEEIKLSEGLDKVASIPGFNGLHNNSKEVLIVLLGYEGKRSLEILNNIEPSITYVIHGMPSYKVGTEEVAILSNKEFLREANIEDNIFYASALDPFDTYLILDKLVNNIQKDMGACNITIVPLGSRLQSLGIFMYAYNINKSIKVAYPFPSSILKGYSRGIGNTYVAAIKL